MKRSIDETLALYTDDGTVVRELHDVPPYRVYEVTLDDTRAVAKIDDHLRGHAAADGCVQQYVEEHTSVSVPSVLAIGDDHFLTEWSHGIAATSETIDTDWARGAGVWVGTLHEDTAGAFDGFGRPRSGADGLTLTPHEDWIDAVRERVSSHHDFLESVGYADVAAAVDRFLEDHPHVFDGAGEPVLCHGDVHPEHLGWTTENTLSAIDFEHAFVAPAEYDYWRTVMPYFEARDDVDTAERRAFRDGYGSVRPFPDGLERRRKAYTVVNLVAFLESLHLQGNVSPPEREAVAQRMRTTVFETLEKLREVGT